MKKIIAVLLSVMILFGTVSFAVSAVRDDKYDHLPQIFVSGFGSKKVYYKDDPEKNSLFYPVPTDKLLKNLENLPTYALDSAKNGDFDVLYNCIYNLFYDTFEDAVLEKDGAFGYDALNNQFVDMFQAGIVDPAKVTRSALENAASVASMLLTTEAAVVDIPEEKGPELPSMPGMGGMGGMM